MRIELSHDDADLLLEVLEEALAELREEIARTDTPEFKGELKARRDRMARLTALLRQMAEVGAGT